MGQLNPTRQEIINAHEALEKLCNRLPGTLYTKMAILAALPEKPRLTMAEVEWDDDKHYLAEAEHTSLGKVVMLSKIREGGEIYYIRRGFEGKLLTLASPDSLTPTGRRYVLQEGE
ncbi:hypothetical protein GWO64_009500 [Corynebacterium macginleyi]|uniref:hypothetical protein n=1 Tax=Corynebacterium macginleyi TaxID=38290 RepID=UPI00190BDA65|nr:hypothetical protein [Corynebacterium macginleyi]QRJ57480.1 hypothetical protein GWO64_009500 [Corynebacterium macginleyi]